LLARLVELDGELTAVRLARGESVDDEHDPEGSTLSSDWSRIAGMRGDLRARRAELDRAEERLASGTYGMCTVCGGEIPELRLVARPWASTCVECAG